MFVDRFLHQISQAEKRFSDSKARREQRRAEIDKIDEGDFQNVDLTILDEASRVTRRLSLAARSGAPTVALERIIESNELMSSFFLTEGARVARTVGRVAIRGSSGGIIGFGTGSLVSPRLLMTNNHVLESSGTAGNSTVQFDFVERFDGSTLTTTEFALQPAAFFETHEDLDCTIVAVDQTATNGNALADRGFSSLIGESGKAIVGERVNIIQHPGGERQQLALRQNRIVDVVGDFLHYETDTRKGSSGSPVSNDSWQTAALHHAGVPKRNSLRQILLNDGTVWDGSRATIPSIAWVANEGARISKIVEWLRGLQDGMAAAERSLLVQLLNRSEIALEPEQADRPARSGLIRPLRLDECGRAVYTIPVEIAVGIPECPGGSPARPANTANVAASGNNGINDSDLQTARDAIRRHEQDVYYDADADQSDIDAYYAGIAEDADLVGKPLFNALHDLVRRTHTTVLSYKTARLQHLYPWVDLHPDRKLESIYSGEGFDAEEVIRNDLEVASLHEVSLSRFLRTEAASDPEALEAFLDDLESASPFNCEHVVPQSWFGKKQPMKADLHHLFTCESGCNSFRSNIPYFQFPPVDEAVRPKCGRREERKFEPSAGKGPAARATFYFLIRYIGLVGDAARELQPDRLSILLKWHAEDPATDYERHRNAAIRAVQGNRNPLIDFPDWAEHIAFEGSFG